MYEQLKLWSIVFIWALSAASSRAAEIYTANLTLQPAFATGYCVKVSRNGYSGTDRRLFIAPQDAYYRIKDYSNVNAPFWIITEEAFDPNVPLGYQALAVSDYWDYATPRQVFLSAGTRVYIWSAYYGGYGSLTGCENDGATKTVTMRIVGEDSGIPSPPTALSGVATRVSFTPGADNGSPITNYEYAFYDEEEEELGSFTALSPADPSSPIRIPGLALDVEVTVRLRAINANGSSTESEALTFTPQLSDEIKWWITRPGDDEEE